MPKRWRRLLECVATYRDDSGAVAIVTPDGRHLDPADAGASDRLSALVDRPVRFAFARDEALQLERANPEDLAAGEPVRFRPNIVFDSVGLEAFVENGWHGALICVGRDLRLRVAFPTPRCAVPTLAHGANAPDPRLTVEIGKINKVPVLDIGPTPCPGAYARIEHPGRVALGDEIYLE
jgi:uncharacterized protein YcbX